MIVLDIEASGLDNGRNGIWQIGALEFENPKNVFFGECRIDDEDEIMLEALELIGKTEAELRDNRKQSQKKLILAFLEWTKTCKNKISIGQNIGWDLTFIQNKCLRYGLRKGFSEFIGVRSIDLHALTQLIHYQINNGFLVGDHGRSDLSLSKIIGFCGIEDKRRIMSKGKIVEEGNPHNALEDVRLTAECFSRIFYGKKLFEEFEGFPLPSYLIK
jgi:DNA polymerase III epsilon subunit-like protein